MEPRHQIVVIAKSILQSRQKRLPEKMRPQTETSLWSEFGFDTSTSSQAIESFIFGNNLSSADLGTCMSCITHFKRMIDQVGLKGPDAKALPILTPPTEDRLAECYHKTSLSDNFTFARLEAWR